MKPMFKTFVIVAVVLAVLAGTAAAIDEITDFSGVHISGSFGTATPALMVNQPSGGAGNPFEIRAANTPVFSVNASGDITYSGTPVVNGVSSINAPTAVATATPAFIVNSLGVSNLFEVRAASTPVFAVSKAGAVTGQVLKYATAGKEVVCGTATVTDTATIATGLTTPLFCLAGLTDIPSGDARTASCAVNSTNVVVKVRNSALTPAANATGAVINWCSIGTK